MPSATRTLQQLRQQCLQALLNDLQRHPRIDHSVAMRRLSRALEIGIAHRLEEPQPFLLETVQAPSRRGAAQADLDGKIEDQRQIGAKLALHEGFELLDALKGQPAATALIGISRIGKTITEHQRTTCQSRPDD